MPGQVWTCGEVSKKLKLPDCMTIGKENWQGCQLYSQAAFTSQEIFCQRLGLLQGGLCQ